MGTKWNVDNSGNLTLFTSIATRSFNNFQQIVVNIDQIHNPGTISVVMNTEYIFTGFAPLVINLPAATPGQRIRIISDIDAGYTINCPGYGYIIMLNTITGLGGSITTTEPNAFIELVCTIFEGQTEFVATAFSGNWTNSDGQFINPLKSEIQSLNILSTTNSTGLGSGSLISSGGMSANGNISSQGLKVSEATNGKQGVASLVAGTASILNNSITANSRIFLTSNDNGVTGSLRTSSITPGTGFVITSNTGSDAGTVAYEIFEPA
jgi:hypothetical protein